MYTIWNREDDVKKTLLFGQTVKRLCTMRNIKQCYRSNPRDHFFYVKHKTTHINIVVMVQFNHPCYEEIIFLHQMYNNGKVVWFSFNMVGGCGKV